MKRLLNIILILPLTIWMCTPKEDTAKSPEISTEMIPISLGPNAQIPNLMLHKDVREAVGKGTFNVYPVERVEQVMSLLSGMPPGEMDEQGAYPAGSFNFRIQQRIEKLQKLQKSDKERDEHADS